MDARATTKEDMTERFIAKNSYFIYEGKNMLIEEFGKDYARYFENTATYRFRLHNSMVK